MITVFKPAPRANFLIIVNGPVSQPVTPIRKRKSCLIPPLLHPPPLSSYQHWCFDLLSPHINLIFPTCTVASLVQTAITLPGLPAPLPLQGGAEYNSKRVQPPHSPLRSLCCPLSSSNPLSEWTKPLAFPHISASQSIPSPQVLVNS